MQFDSFVYLLGNSECGLVLTFTYSGCGIRCFCKVITITSPQGTHIRRCINPRRSWKVVQVCTAFKTSLFRPFFFVMETQHFKIFFSSRKPTYVFPQNKLHFQAELSLILLNYSSHITYCGKICSQKMLVSSQKFHSIYPTFENYSHRHIPVPTTKCCEYPPRDQQPQALVRGRTLGHGPFGKLEWNLLIYSILKTWICEQRIFFLLNLEITDLWKIVWSKYLWQVVMAILKLILFLLF